MTAYGSLYLDAGTGSQTLGLHGSYYLINQFTKIGNVFNLNMNLGGSTISVYDTEAYAIQVDLSGLFAGSSHLIAIFINGVRNDNLTVEYTPSSSAFITYAGLKGFISLTSGDVIDVRITNITKDNVKLALVQANFSVYSIEGAISGPAGGDLTGTYPNPTVIGLQGNAVAATTPTNQYVLTWNASLQQWEPDASAGGPPSGTAGGDLSSSYPNPKVAKIQGRALDASLVTIGTLQDGYALTWVNADNQWEAAPVASSGGFTAGGDLSGTATDQTVSKLQDSILSNPVSSGSAHKVLHGDNGGTLTWSQVDLAADITGTLPTGNQANQSVGGDLSGTTASATVIKLQAHSVTSQTLGSPQDGYLLTWDNTDGYWKAEPNNFSGSASPTGSAGGDLSGTYPNPTVAKIKGNSVTTQTLNSTTDGYVLTWDNTDGYWKAEVIPTQTASGSAGGDLSGTYPNPTVAKIDGYSVPAGGSTGNALQISGSGTLSYAAINLAGGSNYVTGSLPTANQAVQLMGGDVSGTTAAATVIKLQGQSVTAQSLGASQDGYLLTWDNADGYWKAEPNNFSGSASPTGSAGGDLSNTYPNPTVAKIDGYSVPAGGATGNALQISGAGALSYAAINLAGGVNYVTGSLPTANQVAQAMGGDVSGTTAAATVIKLQGNAITVQSLGSSQDGYLLTWDNTDGYWKAEPNNFSGSTSPTGSAGGDLSGTYPNPTVAKIDGASVPAAGSLTTGNVLQVNGSSALTYAAVNLGGGPNYVTGTLPTGNQAAQVLAGDVTGTTAAATVVKVQGNPVKSATYGAAQDGYVLTWVNADGYVEAKPAAGGAPSGSAGGDLSGSYPNPTVAKIQTNQVDATVLGTNQDGYVMTWVNSGNNWIAKDPIQQIFMSGKRISYWSGGTNDLVISGIGLAGCMNCQLQVAGSVLSGNIFAAPPANGSLLGTTPRLRTDTASNGGANFGAYDINSTSLSGVVGVWRGNSSGLGGFINATRFGFDGYTTSAGGAGTPYGNKVGANVQFKTFVGLSDGYAGSFPATNYDWTTGTTYNAVGFGFTLTASALGVLSGNWQFITCSTGGGNITVTDTGMAVTIGDMMETIIQCQPNGSNFSWTINNISQSTTATGVATQHLPTNHVIMMWQCTTYLVSGTNASTSTNFMSVVRYFMESS